MVCEYMEMINKGIKCSNKMLASVMNNENNIFDHYAVYAQYP